ncbi:hypothetical protein QAD02_010690 [Eretmocerus hayati]|uniref:Uncharacterized protein n=1 Tax=Eretmocerus hayati TaxID=131215 RepID=A0ACC2NUJ1_9HYME|nr:hypothetical protein QAD02_010690 [Eretmocerus hayati]
MKREKKPGEPNFSLPFVLVTILVCALREAGSMSQLQAELESIDSHKDPCNRGFSSNGEFDSYKSLHSLPVHKLDDKDFDYCMWGVALALRGILRFSQVFETPHDFEDVKKLRKNKTALFVTSFLFRASCASHDKCFHTHLFEPSKQIIDSCDKSIENFVNPTEGLGDRDEDFLNVTLALASSLITIGCVPNVDKCITFANKVVFYVLRPIKAGSQIIYGGKMDSSFYELAAKSSRQSAHQKFYNCPCECEACINDWSEILPTMTGVFKVPLPLRRSEDECLIEMEAIMDEWIANAHKQNYPNFKQISKTRDVMVKAWKCIPMPSLAIIYIISSARILFQSFYDPSEVSTKHIAIQFKKRLALLPRLDMKEIRKNIHYD